MLNDDLRRLQRFASSGEDTAWAAGERYAAQLAAAAGGEAPLKGASADDDHVLEDAIGALRALGLTKKEAEIKVKRVWKPGFTLEKTVSDAMRG